MVSVSGCGSIKELEIFSKQVERTPLNIDPPAPKKMETVKWIVITKDNYKEVFAQLEKNGQDVVLFGLTDDGYENMSVNMAQIRKYIAQNRSILMKYKEYYEGNKNKKEG